MGKGHNKVPFDSIRRDGGRGVKANSWVYI